MPVTLYDEDGLEKNGLIESSVPYRAPGKIRLPPRYVVGILGFFDHSQSQPMPSKLLTQHLTTFDLGNSKQTLLTVQDCLGCRSKIQPNSGCPSTVPSCEIELQSSNEPRFCWPSHPNQFVPDTTFIYTNKNCSDGAQYAGELMNKSAWMQCFDNSDHARYTSSAMAYELSLYNAVVKRGDETLDPTPIIKNFNFGALVRTVPSINRIWSNVGIGANSSFLNQLSINSILLDFDYYQTQPTHSNEKIVFNPSRKLYNSWELSPYEIVRDKRLHPIDGFYFGNEAVQNSTIIDMNITFHIDTGNDGISIHDNAIRDCLKTGASGEWLSPWEDENATQVLYTPWNHENGPDVHIMLRPDIEVTIPAWVWILPHSNFTIRSTVEDSNTHVAHEHRRVNTTLNPTIFRTYHKNVFGLPFLSAPEYCFVFEDEEKSLFVGRKSFMTD